LIPKEKSDLSALPTFRYKGKEYTVDERLREFRFAVPFGKRAEFEFIPFDSPQGQEMRKAYYTLRIIEKKRVGRVPMLTIGQEYQKDELEDIRLLTKAGKALKGIRDNMVYLRSLGKFEAIALRGGSEASVTFATWLAGIDEVLEELRISVKRERAEIQKYFELISGFE